VSENNIEVIGATGLAIFPKKSKFNLQNILIFAVVILILINIIWFIVIKRLLKKVKKS